MGVEFFVPVLSQTLAVSGQSDLANVDVSGGLVVNGLTRTDAFAAFGMAAMSAGLQVFSGLTTDTIIATGSTTMQAGLTVSAGTLTVADTTTLNGQLTVADGGLIVTGTPGVYGMTELGGDLEVHGTMILDGSGAMATGFVTIGGLLSANGGLKVAGEFSIQSLTVPNDCAVGGYIEVTGMSKLLGGATSVTASLGDNSTKVATTAYTMSAVATEATRAQGVEALKAPLASPAFTGSPTAPTASLGDNSTKVATTAYTMSAIGAAITGLVNGAPEAVDTLKEIADALGNDANLSATLVNSIALKANKASPTFTSGITLSTGDLGVSAGNVVLNSTEAGKGRIQFAARDSMGDYFMGVDASDPSDKLVIRKGDVSLMAISDSGFVGGTPAVQTVTFGAPVAFHDLIDLTNANCKIKLSATEYITGEMLLTFLKSTSHTAIVPLAI